MTEQDRTKYGEEFVARLRSERDAAQAANALLDCELKARLEAAEAERDEETESRREAYRERQDLRDKLRWSEAEITRMRPVVEAAIDWYRWSPSQTRTRALGQAVDAYIAQEEEGKTNDG